MSFLLHLCIGDDVRVNQMYSWSRRPLLKDGTAKRERHSTQQCFWMTVDWKLHNTVPLVRISYENVFAVRVNSLGGKDHQAHIGVLLTGR